VLRAHPDTPMRWVVAVRANGWFEACRPDPREMESTWYTSCCSNQCIIALARYQAPKEFLVRPARPAAWATEGPYYRWAQLKRQNSADVDLTAQPRYRSSSLGHFGRPQATTWISRSATLTFQGPDRCSPQLDLSARLKRWTSTSW